MQEKEIYLKKTKTARQMSEIPTLSILQKKLTPVRFPIETSTTLTPPFTIRDFITTPIPATLIADHAEF